MPAPTTQQQSAPAPKKYRAVRGSITHSHSETEGARRTLEGETCELDDAEAKRLTALGAVELVK